jgi:hypothetical protein
MTLDQLEALDAEGRIAAFSLEERRRFAEWCDLMGVPVDGAHLAALLETWTAWERPITDPTPRPRARGNSAR